MQNMKRIHILESTLRYLLDEGRNVEFLNDGKEWFQYISPVFFDDFSKVIMKDGLENLINKNGKLFYMKKIHILENALRYLLDEGRNAEKAKQKTIAVMKGYLSQNGVQGRQLESMAMEYENSFKEWLFHANMPDSIIRLEPIMANVAIQLGFTPTNKDTRELYRLKSIANYIIANYQKEGFPIALNKLTLNNTSFESLNELFGNAIDSQRAADKAASKSYGQDMNPNYSVVRLNTFEEANEYYPYTQDICYLGCEETWDNYTNDDMYTVYVILRNDWEDVPEEHGKNTPYDNYGLSMIFVIVNLDGDIAYSNTRWNHDTNGLGPRDVDQSFTKSMISKLLHVDFDSVFVSKYNKELLQKKFASLTHKAQFICRQCKRIHTSFLSRFEAYDGLNSSYIAVYLDGFWNIVDNDGNIMFPNEWFFSVRRLAQDVIYICNVRDKVNLLNNECKFINGGKEWYNNAEEFYKNIIFVENNNELCNLLFPNGNLIGDGQQWFKEINYFKDGFAKIMLPNKLWNFTDENGNIISPNLWFKSVTNFYNGLAEVEREDGLCNLLAPNGQLINGGKQWFKSIDSFYDGFAEVENEKGQTNLMRTDGNLINGGKEWFESIHSMFIYGYTKVMRSDKLLNLMDKNGNYINGGKEWFQKIKLRDDDKWEVQRQDGTICLLDIHGKLHPLTESRYLNINQLIENHLHMSIRDYLLYK